MTSLQVKSLATLDHQWRHYTLHIVTLFRNNAIDSRAEEQSCHHSGALIDMQTTKLRYVPQRTDNLSVHLQIVVNSKVTLKPVTDEHLSTSLETQRVASHCRGNYLSLRLITGTEYSVFLLICKLYMNIDCFKL